MANQPISDPANPGNTLQNASTASKIEANAERFKDGTSSTVQSAKDKFGTAADKVEAGMHSATDASARAAVRATEKASELRDRSRELAEDARERAEDALDAVRDYVRERPAQSVAIALASGWVLGRLLGGRR